MKMQEKMLTWSDTSERRPGHHSLLSPPLPSPGLHPDMVTLSRRRSVLPLPASASSHSSDSPTTDRYKTSGLP